MRGINCRVLRVKDHPRVQNLEKGEAQNDQDPASDDHLAGGVTALPVLVILK
jgi:hypothetical protein